MNGLDAPRLDAVDAARPADAARAATVHKAGSPSSMSATTGAHAVLGVGLRPGADGRARSCVTSLHSESPLKLRTANAKEAEPLTAAGADFVRVCLAASAAGPIGGDHLRLDVHVQAGSTLVLTEVSATLLLPGRDGARSRTDVRIFVDDAAALVWLPEPVIAARGCHHLNDVRVHLAATARLLMREELILGRHGESPGVLRQRTRIELAGRSAYAQDLEVGTGTSLSPSVVGTHRSLGSLLVFDPAWTSQPPWARQLSGHAALMPLASAGMLISAVGTDNVEVRAALRAGLKALGAPWDPHAAPDSNPSPGG